MTTAAKSAERMTADVAGELLVIKVVGKGLGLIVLPLSTVTPERTTPVTTCTSAAFRTASTSEPWRRPSASTVRYVRSFPFPDHDCDCMLICSIDTGHKDADHVRSAHARVAWVRLCDDGPAGRGRSCDRGSQRPRAFWPYFERSESPSWPCSYTDSGSLLWTA